MWLGKTKIENGLFLAPMAGFSDRAMRLVARMHGAEFVVSEMVSAKAVVYRDKKTERLARLSEDEGPASVQIFGSDPEIMAEAAEMLSGGVAGGVAPRAIDINMGCPVPKVYKNGEGSALMASPEKIEKIVSAVKSRISIPCTVKLRLGLDRDSENVLDCARAAESGGADMIAIHGRTRAELYAGNARYEKITDVKKALQIPVIANGDICSGEDALRVLSETGADGIMIGRAAIGNPFIFEQILAALRGEAYEVRGLSERIECALLQLRLAIEDKGEPVAAREARGQIARYLVGFRGAGALRAAINRAETYAEVEAALRSVQFP